MFRFKVLAKDILVYGILHVSSRIFAFFLIPIYARIFQPAEFALYDFALTLLNIFVLIAPLEIHSGFARHFYEAEEKGNLKQLLGTTFVFIFLSSTIFIFLIWFLFIKYFNGYKGINSSLFLPIALSVLFFPLYNLITIFLRFQRRLLHYGVLSIGDMFVSAGLSLFFIFFLKTGIKGIFFGLLISKIILVIIGFVLIKQFFSLSFSLDQCKQILCYSIPLVPSVISGWLQNQANRFVLISTVSLSDMGVFSLGARIVSIMTLIQMVFRTAWLPHSVKLMEMEDSDKVYAKVLKYYLLGMGSLAIIIILFAKELVFLFGGEKYKGASLILSILTIGYLYLGSLNIIGVGNHIVKKTYYITIGSFTGGIVNVFFLYLTVYHLGIISAAISFVLGSITTFIIVLLTAQKNKFIPYNYFHLILVSFILVFTNSIVYMVDKFDSNCFAFIIFKIIFFSVLFIILVNVLCEKHEKTKLKAIFCEVSNKVFFHQI